MANTTGPTPFVALYDIHHGMEDRRGRKEAAHDAKLLDAVGQFVGDFKPKLVVLGGDNLNCAPVSHWLKDNKRAREGMRWAKELEAFDQEFFSPLNDALPRGTRKVWLDGNHEAWVEQLLDKRPELEGLLHHRDELSLARRGWEYYAQGDIVREGHLYFIHGDTVSGGEHVAKSAVLQYDVNIRFGHFHTFQTYTRVSAAQQRERKTGVSVPCLGRLNPSYLKDKPTKWIQGFQFGWINPNGTFADYTAIATDGRFTVNGKTYKG